MKAFEVRRTAWRALGAFVLLTTSPVFAQSAPVPPPLPPAPKTLPRRADGNLPLRPVAQVAATAPAPAAVAPAPPFVSAPVAVPAAVAPALQSPFAPADPSAIKWEADTKEQTPKEGAAEAKFTFWLTNVSPSEVLVNSVRTSCGCTVAKLPSQPWHIAPGSNGPIDVTVNLAGKSGTISKGVTVETSTGVKQLTVTVHMPTSAPGSLPVQASGAMGDTDRLKNMQLAMSDRQVVFKNQECAKCHAEPAKGKTDGRLLYAAVCATCHNSHLRAAMVPDLRALPHPTNAEHWRTWTTYGRAGSMMPAFAESEGGPLNEQQISALVDFMVKAFPSRPQPAQNANAFPVNKTP